jgi:5-(carboxyamino)imidazole ribonucleotide mutase
MEMAIVAVVMGSDSDLPVMKDTCQILEKFGVGYERRILSAHRTPDDTIAYAKSAYDNGIRVIIAAAGGAAHLAGIMAAHTVIPVIGVPIETKLMGGCDSLFSMVQMPAGVPVATMAVGPAGARNAALFAISILSLKDAGLREKLTGYRKEMADAVRQKNRNTVI